MTLDWCVSNFMGSRTTKNSRKFKFARPQVQFNQQRIVLLHVSLAGVAKSRSLSILRFFVLAMLIIFLYSDWFTLKLPVRASQTGRDLTIRHAMKNSQGLRSASSEWDFPWERACTNLHSIGTSLCLHGLASRTFLHFQLLISLARHMQKNEVDVLPSSGRFRLDLVRVST